MFPKINNYAQVTGFLLFLMFTPFIVSAHVTNLPPANVGLRGFDFSTSESGWILLGEQLYRTSDGGQTWTDITPPLNMHSEIRTASFMGSNAWAVLTRPADNGSITYELATSKDGGEHWILHNLALFSPDENWISPEAIFLFLLNDQTGWLVIQHATGVNFSVGSLFGTNDGGRSWERLSIPVGEPVVFVTPNMGWTKGGVTGTELFRSRNGGLSWEAASSSSPDLPGAFRTPEFASPSDGDITRLDILNENTAWALISSGECQFNSEKTNLACSTNSSLRRTLNHGQTWQVISLPTIPTGIFESQTVFTSESKSATPANTAGSTQMIIGQGFDMCEITDLSKMQIWWDASPYTAVNLYIGGSSRGCSNANLSASYLAQLERQGWKFIPTWVGPQAPCTSYTNKIPWDPGLAYFQGVEEANAALATAEQLGLTDSDQSGTVIYYDLEAYGLNDPDCMKASNNFIVGWTERMEAKGNIAGLYGSYYSDLLGIANHPTVVPDAVWIAHWIFPAYDSTATVWDAFRIPNDLWPNHQRIRQYTGGHDETWGGLTLNIDSNVLDGIAAVRNTNLENDDFADAAPILSVPYADSRTIAPATSEVDDPVFPCTAGQGYQTAWYQFSPATSGRALVSTAGSSYDTVLAVWTGLRGNLVSLGCSDDFNGLDSELQFDVTAGTVYYIEIASKDPIANGILFLSVHSPASDDFNGAQIAPAMPYSHSMDTTSAGDSNDDPAVPVCNLSPGRNSVWYAFTPTSSGPVSMDTFSSNYDTYLAVWSGTRGNLILIGCNDDIDGTMQSQLEATLTGGTTYYLEVGQYAGTITPPAISKLYLEAKAVSGGILNFHITTFFDVPGNHWAWNWIERLSKSGITIGCDISPKIFCPEDAVTRAQMAIFILRGIHGAAFIPPAATGVFQDVPPSYWASAWIEQLFMEGITAGCGNGIYCPEESVTRAQMAIFLLRTKYGSSYIPPTASGTVFVDVPSTHWAAAWIEQLYFEGITTGCGNSTYCPEEPVKRAEMAVFLVRTFALP